MQQKPKQKPKKWPSYCLDCWDGTVYNLKVIDELAQQVQEVAVLAGHFEIAKSANDIRTRTIDARSLMHQARTGDYE